MRATIHQQMQTMETIGGESFVQDLIQIFFSECDAAFSKIETALPGGNLSEAGKLFHKVQGSAASTGATRLRRICALGEEACQQGNNQKASRSFRLGSKEMSKVKSYFEDWKKA